MLEFPEDFFLPEYRENFLVDTTMKTVWAAEMELLSDIAHVCRKYDLQYYVFWGTLLGAVRHKGFVPWDDDLDIALKRPDYQKLMEVLSAELPETYRVYHPLSEKGHDQFWGCVANADTISIEAERLKKFHGCPFWVGIDVVPLDYVPRDRKEAEILHSFMVIFAKAIGLVKKKDKSEEEMQEMEDMLDFLERNLNAQINRSMPIANQLCRLENLLALSYGETDGDMLTVHPSSVRRQNYYFPREWWDTVIEVPFETITVPIPAGYDEVLTAHYGDYRERVRGGAEHNYPYYTAQLEQLRNMVKEMESRG